MNGVLWPYTRKLREELAMQRVSASPASSLIETGSGRIRRNRENWVTLWLDEGHAVSVDGGAITAYRGIESLGRLLWLVRHEAKRYGYHSLENDPYKAIHEALSAWEARREIRARWHVVEQVASDLLVGRRRFDVTLEDAHNSPLCSVGIDAFRRRMRIRHITRISGRTAALLMKIEPQLGFVIYQAYLRTEQERAEIAPMY